MIAVLVLALAATGPAAAPAHDQAVIEPNWAEKPSGDDFADLYPPAAQLAGVAGEVRMTCGVTATGALFGCTVVAEEPAGYGFGDATLKLASKFRMTPRFRDGVAVGSGKVTIPLHWQVQGPTQAEPGDGAIFRRPLHWTGHPSMVDLGEAYPRAALAAGVSGLATLACSIAEDGTLADCKIFDEEPSGVGFGTAAMSLASKFRAATTDFGGNLTIGATAVVPIVFRADAQSQLPAVGSAAPTTAPGK